MLKPLLTIPDLMDAAKIFCVSESARPNALLYGVTDGKAVGTLIEQSFQKYLNEHFLVQIGNSAKGIDLPAVTLKQL